MAATLEAPAKPHAWRDDVDRDQVDTTVDIVTPENTAFTYRVAGPFRRLPAYLIDLGIRVLAFVVLFIGIAIISGVTGSQTLFLVLLSVWVVGAFVAQWFYGGLFETYWNGQTPGKRLLGIRVLTVEGQPINMLQAVMRNILRTADFLPPFLLTVFEPLSTVDFFATMFEGMFGSRNPPPVPMGLTVVVGLIVMTMNNRYQRLGDLVCGTMVVIEERSWLMGIARLEDPRAAQLAAYLPPNYVVSRSLAKTLATYVERRQYFSLNRRREIARHLAEPLLMRFGLPADTSHDLLLCALYYRTFIADRGNEDLTQTASPFQQPGGRIIVQANLNPPQQVNPGEIRIRT